MAAVGGSTGVVEQALAGRRRSSDGPALQSLRFSLQQLLK